jgi:hypothetical protein
MNSGRFDIITRSLARNLPRRRLLRTAAAATAAFGAHRLGNHPAVAQEEDAGTVGVRSTPCNCVGEECERCLVGITGGGVVRTTAGDVNLVLFATQLGDDAPQQAAGFVRWIDPNAEGGLMLESVGPITYDWPEGEDHLRYVHGIMKINGQDEHPFVLEAFDAGPGKATEDTARLLVGDATGGNGSSGFGYEATGTLIGGDLQLLTDVAPVSAAP